MARVDINEKGWLTLNQRQLSPLTPSSDKWMLPFNSIIFIHGVSQYWCEEMPLFQLKVTGPDDLRKLFSLKDKSKKIIIAFEVPRSYTR